MKAMASTFWRVSFHLSLRKFLLSSCFWKREHNPLILFRTALEAYFVSIMQIILTRLQSSKTENLTLRFVRFYHFICAHDNKGYSADFFIQATENVQAG